MNEILKNRHEIIFLYDIKDANPNGDPMDDNKPRMDEETDTNIVTDVRLKRTIRDYLHDFKGKEIFIREISDDNGKIQDAKLRARDFLYKKDASGNIEGVEKMEPKNVTLDQMKNIISDNILGECIDVRLFGATIPIEKDAKNKSSVTYTGPVQFRMGRSMHKVEVKFIQGTGAFASKEGATQKTFREEYIVPYSLIAFYGIANENAAKTTKMTEQDLIDLRDAIWNGTKNLISRSKVGQVPRLYIEIEYKDSNYHIGDLDKYMELVKKDSSLDDKAIRDVGDYYIGIGPLYNLLDRNKDKIKSVYVIKDERLSIVKNREEVNDIISLFHTFSL